MSYRIYLVGPGGDFIPWVTIHGEPRDFGSWDEALEKAELWIARGARYVYIESQQTQISQYLLHPDIEESIPE